MNYVLKMVYPLVKKTLKFFAKLFIKNISTPLAHDKCYYFWAYCFMDCLSLIDQVIISINLSS